MKAAAYVATIAAALVASPTLAEVSARAPDSVMKALVTLGYQATMSTASDGSASIKLTIDGSPSSIEFFNCDKTGANCETLLLAYGMDLEKGASLEQVNAWNRDTIHGFVYTDDEADPWLNLTFPTGAGVSDELFATIMRTWRARIGDVRAFFDF